MSPENHHSLAQNALILGGGSGIGRAVALKLVEQGIKVAISGRRETSLKETISLHQHNSSNSKEILSHTSDITERESLKHLFEWYDQTIGSLDILIHASGINLPNRNIDELLPSEWDCLINTNLTGSFNILKLALERMPVSYTHLTLPTILRV